MLSFKQLSGVSYNYASIIINCLFCTECVLYTNWKSMLVSLFHPIPKISCHCPRFCPCRLRLFAERLPRPVIGRPCVTSPSEAQPHLPHFFQNFRLWPSQVRLLAGITYPPQPVLKHAHLLFLMGHCWLGSELTPDWGLSSSPVACGMYMWLDT